MILLGVLSFSSTFTHFSRLSSKQLKSHLPRRRRQQKREEMFVLGEKIRYCVYIYGMEIRWKMEGSKRMGWKFRIWKNI
jgi:hypothetical protein